MSYPSQYRRREHDRMVRQLEAGARPHTISGDRDILEAALATVQRRADVADDLPNTDPEAYGRRRP